MARSGLEKTPHSIVQCCFRHRGKLGRARIHSRCGLIFHVAARVAVVMRPVMSAPIGTASASAPVAAHPIEENASAAVNRPPQIQSMDARSLICDIPPHPGAMR